EERVRVPYTFFRDQVQAGNVSDVSSSGETITGAFRRGVDPPGAERSALRFVTVRPDFADDHLLALLEAKNVQVKAASPARPGVVATLLIGFGPTLLLVGLFIFLGRRFVGGGIGGLGRSRAKRYDSNGHRTTFDDIAGIEEAEEELVEIVDFLRDPE